jgi:hypothetical protein
MSAAQQLLDRVRSIATIAELEADPARYAQQLAAEVPEQAARDAFFATAVRNIDELTARVMRIRLDHVLANDTAIAAPTRRVFASTIVGYAEDLALLADRVRDVASRGGAAHADQIANDVVDAARTTLALRAALRTDVLALIAKLAPVAEQPEEPAPEPEFADLIELD